MKYEKNLEKIQRKNSYGGVKVRITSKFSSEIMQARREGSEIFKVLKEKKPTNLEFCNLQNYPSKVKEKNFLSQTKFERIYYK